MTTTNNAAVLNFPMSPEMRARANRQAEEARLAARPIHVGSKFLMTEDLDVSEVAKLIRADIKAAVKSGELLPATYSVKIKRYSGGASIDCFVCEASFPRRVIDVAEVEARREAKIPCPWITDEARTTKEKVEKIIAAYNRDASDGLTDLYDYKFASSVHI